MSELSLSAADRAMLHGELGQACSMAMRLIVGAARAMSAPALIDVTSAHVDGCLHHGQVSLDFVDRLVAGGGQVRVPTTLNVGSLDLIHPTLFRGSTVLASEGKRLMEAHLALGCEATFTCAPYQRMHRPHLGEQIAWAESNAIVFANSVLGARTNRYGDFIDLCAALTGRVPLAGLHVAANRLAQVVVDVAALPPGAHDRDVWFALIGLVLGTKVDTLIPVLVGLPEDSTEDELKALGAAGASTGAVSMFHAVGVTAEAATLEHATGGERPIRRIEITAIDILQARQRLNQASSGDRLAAVSLGTPHFSMQEFGRLRALLRELDGPLRVPVYVNTSRYILWQLEEAGWLPELQERDIKLVTDTCTYLTPVIDITDGAVMTNSGKMAHYAPSNMGVRLAFGSLSECLRSALLGEVVFHG